MSASFMGGTARRPWGLTVAVLTVAALGAGAADAAPNVPMPRTRPAIKTAAAPKAAVNPSAMALPRARPRERMASPKVRPPRPQR